MTLARHRLVEPLLSDIGGVTKYTPVDLVVFSGDAVDKGGASFGSVAAGLDVFRRCLVDPLLDDLGLTLDHLVIVPGNHDVDRTLDSPIVEAGLRVGLSGLEELNKFLGGDLAEGVNRIQPFLAFRDGLYQSADCVVASSKFFTCHRIETTNGVFGVVGFNTSWRCYGTDKDDHGSLLLGERTVVEALGALHDSDVKIAVTHHPLGYLAGYDRTVIEPLFQTNFDLHFVGHVHSSASSKLSQPHGSLVSSVAAGTLRRNYHNSNTDFHNGYSLIRIDRTTHEAHIHVRRYIADSNSFAPDTSIGGDTGIATYGLPTTEQVSRRLRERELVLKIGNSSDELMNEHLVTYGTDTRAPKSIRELFVTPAIVLRKRSADDDIDDINDPEADEVPLSVEEILLSSQSYLLCGQKESGKTILLDRVFTLLVDDVDKYWKIPIRIEWAALGNRRIETVINRETGVGSNAVADLCTNHKIALLIDNIEFGDESARKLRALSEFLARYPNTQVIATQTVEQAGQIAVELFKYSQALQLAPVHIKGFRVKQIKALAERWFAGSPESDLNRNVDQLVKLIVTLNLPANPLALSIFLWIIEKQESYRPTNASTMMENFVERLFQKQHGAEAFSDKFDSHNKHRLLAEIAEEMYRAGNQDYAMSYRDLLSFVQQQIDDKLFDFDADKIVAYFISIGLFTRRDHEVHFRFKCFFEYFLAKRMEFDTAFSGHALRTDQILRFTAEIKYLTGLQRSRTDILAKVLQRMELEFNEVASQLQETGTYDEAFNEVRSMLGSSDSAKLLGSVVEQRPTEEELDAADDTRLGMVEPTKGIDQKREPASRFGRLGKLLNLAAAVLRNTEETTDAGLKRESYQRIVACALVYTILYRFEIQRYISENDQEIPRGFKEVFQWVADYAPIIVQLALKMELGTRKLNKIFLEEIDRMHRGKSSSELERFFSVFLYADNRGKDYHKHIGHFIKDIRHPYMEMNVFVKIVSYYYLRSRDDETDRKLLNLLGDLIVQAKGLRARDKSKIMNQHRRNRLRRSLKVDESQTELAL